MMLVNRSASSVTAVVDVSGEAVVSNRLVGSSAAHRVAVARESAASMTFW
jgi:hypothetical protein